MLDKIKALCKEKKTSISKLEKQLGFGNGVIGRWDKSVPSYERLAAVANALDVPVAYLTGETDDPSAGIKKERPADGEALIRDLPEDIQKIIRICMNRPELASALLNLAKQIEKD